LNSVGGFMDRSCTNYIIDMAMTFLFAAVAVTGIILFFFLPNGVPRSGHLEFLSIIKSQWASIHGWAGIMLVVLIALHIVLHLGWIKTMTRRFLLKDEGKTV
ncbi:MAG: DUF4405 domain-containing protein, partial [archaeon]|nr:DUF4405 domain-containing protein [archaeon]